MSSSIASADDQQAFMWNRFRYPIERYAQRDAIKIADVIVKLQRPTGGWGKTVAPDEGYSTVSLEAVAALEYSLSLLHDGASKTSTYSHHATTLDNGATHSHIRYLMRVARATKDIKYQKSAITGLHYLLDAQLESGGWPQNYPNMSSYGGHITFNDGAMAGALTALQEVATGEYYFIKPALMKQVQMAIDLGVEFILRSQIVISGKRTVWCAQHNNVDYKPEGGRIYELPSLSGAESVGIIKVLMRIDRPNARVIASIKSAVNWLYEAKIEHIYLTKVPDEKYTGKFHLQIKEDPSGEKTRSYSYLGRGYDLEVVAGGHRPMWARFYDLSSQKPIFAGWDGVAKSSLSLIDYERRVGYMWYGYWAETLLKRDLPRWKKKWID
ncbi:MAG: pectate lyase [Pseudomonadales bacterium]|nr:pectate lyase [Pseudomonadales bacterium]